MTIHLPLRFGNRAEHAVPLRIERQRVLLDLAEKPQAVMEALGRRRCLWFAYEELQGRLTSLREAAYFDLGVAHGVAEARTVPLMRRSKAVEQLAARLVREVLGPTWWTRTKRRPSSWRLGQ